MQLQFVILQRLSNVAGERDPIGVRRLILPLSVP